MKPHRPVEEALSAVSGPVDYLSPLPTELILKIFCALPSLQDVLMFSATSKTLKRILDENAHPIVDHVGGPVWPRARQLLADQRRLDPNTLTYGRKSIIKFLQNQKAVERAVEKFEEYVVRANKRGNYDHDTKTVVYPQHLTPRERIRFVRTWYDLWSFVTIHENEWTQRLDRMTRLKHLELLHEMCRLTNLYPASAREDMLSLLTCATNSKQAEIVREIDDLSAAVRLRAQALYESHFGVRINTGQGCSKFSTGISPGFKFIFDHGQKCCLRIQVTRPMLESWEEVPDHCEVNMATWDEETDDEM